MEDLHWPLTVLTRSIHYKNATNAAQNIGLSQPQISRLINKIEDTLGLSLLDKSSPRNTVWTADARKLAEIYNKSARTLEISLTNLKEDQIPKTISIGTLEGLSSLAIDYSQRLFAETSLQQIQLDVFDQNEMENQFLTGEVDIIFTSRAPGKKKYNFIETLGYQRLDEFIGDKSTNVYSPYEYGFIKNKSDLKQRSFISNSLAIRGDYLRNGNGVGKLPSDIHQSQTKGDLPVLVVGQDYLHRSFWFTS
jgi:hypothetical protein